jgi:TolB protein
MIVTQMPMRTVILLLFLTVAVPAVPYAQTGYIEVTAPGNRQLRLAVEMPRTQDKAPNNAVASELSDVIAYDMNMSGIALAEPREAAPFSGGLIFGAVDFAAWQTAGFTLLVRGEYSLRGDDLTVEFRLYDLLNRTLVTAKRYLGSKRDLRRFSHAFCDEIMLRMTGEAGCFSTRIAFVTTQSGNKEIAVMDWDGYNQVALTGNGSINLNPDFSPDGREVIYTSYKRGNPDLFRRTLASPLEIPVSTRQGLNITGAWSPDGTRIALTLSKDGNSEIYTIARDGSHPVRLTTTPSIEVSPAWSPDGGRIAFVSDRLGKPQIFIMNADGSNVRRLTTSGTYNVTPRWSPRGDRILYARMTGSGFQIYVINADGSSDTQLTSTGSNENPVWSPDGRFIAFASKRGGSTAIYVMRADGSAQTRISRGKGSAGQPAWSSH